MSTQLERILAHTRIEVAERRAAADVSLLERQAAAHIPRGFEAALRQAAASGLAVIAELKKASPSRGLIRADFHPDKLAQELEAAGASALSVLTDEEFFQGSLENLRVASANTRIPCLRKDFIVDEFQIVEARANCADAILLIVAALSQEELLRLASHSRQLGLDVLCEAHDEVELTRALDAGCDLVGINSRDLRTFMVDIQTAFRLGELIQQNVMSVAESGIHSADDITRLRAAGYQAFLIGESLMKAESAGDALRDLLQTANHQRRKTVL